MRERTMERGKGGWNACRAIESSLDRTGGLSDDRFGESSQLPAPTVRWNRATI
jgi:hypothetical protein